PMLDLSTAIGGQAGRSFVDAMVAATLPEAPSSLREALFAQTAGLPLFVTAILRWFQAEGADRLGAWDPDGIRWMPGSGNLPTEINVLFEGLVTRLPRDAQSLLDAASVQGAIFSAEVVMRVMGLCRPTLIEIVDHQLTRRFRALTEGGVSTVAGQRSHEYRFAHALFRDFLYHRMNDLERAHYHAATAEAMLALYGHGLHNGAAPIAFHLDQAGARHDAARAYLKAGDFAMDHQNYEQASAFFDRIGELDLRREDPSTTALALVGLGNCARGQGNATQAATMFHQAHELAQREGLLLVQANSLTSMGMLDYDAGRMNDGTQRLRQAIDVLIELGDLEEACRSLALLSHTLHGLGHYDEAVEAARRSIALGTDLRNELLEVNGMIALANCWLDIGRYSEAIAIYEEAIDVSGKHGNVHRAAMCWINIALCELEREAWDRASDALEHVFEVGQAINTRLLAVTEYEAGAIAEGEGHLSEATGHYQASFDMHVHNNEPALVIDSLAGLLRVATAERRHDRARTLIPDIQARIDRQGVDGVEHYGRLFVTLASAALELGERGCARQGVGVITERAARLADPAHRASYLTNPPAHRRLFELAAELGISSA
ncbi:MAG: hypothetical protein M3457_17675, partial [Chloroflexota bacterium]|nr:hypothetical protein [Chloroflexota bacterium]